MNKPRRSLKHNSVTRRFCAAVWGCISFVPLVLSLSAYSQADDHTDKVKAFQNAINYQQDNKGCLSIPYPDLQGSCTTKQSEVNKLCKDSGPRNCEDVDPKKTQKEIEHLKTNRDELKTKKKELEEKKSSLTNDNDKRDNEEQIKKVGDELYGLKISQEELEKKVSDSIKMINDRIYVSKGCIDNRESVMQIFKDAKSRAGSEHDADIEPLAKKLITGWEAKEPGHEQQITEAKQGLAKCGQVLYDIGHLGNF